MEYQSSPDTVDRAIMACGSLPRLGQSRSPLPSWFDPDRLERNTTPATLKPVYTNRQLWAGVNFKLISLVRNPPGWQDVRFAKIDGEMTAFEAQPRHATKSVQESREARESEEDEWGEWKEGGAVEEKGAKAEEEEDEDEEQRRREGEEHGKREEEEEGEDEGEAREELLTRRNGCDLARTESLTVPSTDGDGPGLDPTRSGNSSSSPGQAIKRRVLDWLRKT
ncbi:hypothetical protein F4778DRAFT_386664 [Xylariomycetidae sp. FL2044]|nr:hypothetical protein F4778DRAFT_386664 [Xylariomycetidae sp. FL2044]